MIVELVDATACTDVAAVEEAVAPVVAGRPVGVRVEVLPEGERRAVSVAVLRRGVLVWSRELVVAEADCPLLPTVVAATVEQGLAALPELSAAQRPTVSADFGAAGTLGAPPVHPGAQLTARLGVGAPELWWTVELRAGATAWMGVGTGQGRFDEVLAGMGPTFAVGRVSLGALGLAGGAFARGRGFSFDERATVPRAVASASAGWAIAGPWVAELGVSVPITRLALLGDGAQSEPPARLSLGIAWSTRKP